jgi:hypothetical protein
MKVNAPSVSASSFWARRCTSHQTLGCRVFAFCPYFSFGKGGEILLVLTNVGHLQWPRQLASGGFHPIGALQINSSYQSIHHIGGFYGSIHPYFFIHTEFFW